MNDTIPELSKFKSKNEAIKPSNKLSSLWLKIEKHQKRNENFSKKTAQLFDKFTQDALPYEQKQAEIIATQVEHLTGFISKKSLSETQREELLNWIESDIEYLDSHPFAKNINTSNLREKVNIELTLLAKILDQKVDDESIAQLQDMLDDMFNGEMQLDRDELINIIKNPDQLEKHLKDFCENIQEPYTHSDDNIDQSNESFENDDYYQDYEDFGKHIGPKNSDTLEKLFKGSQLNKMYKRLASKLHPDKENDPAKKLIKHDLMQQLATARNNKDVFTLLTLYHEHIKDDSFNFDIDTISAIESLLTQKVSELNYELRELKSSCTPENIVWKNFNGRSNKITSQNINNHINQLKDEYALMNQFITNTKTVKALKTELSARIKQRKSSSFFNFGGSLEDLLNMNF